MRFSLDGQCMFLIVLNTKNTRKIFRANSTNPPHFFQQSKSEVAYDCKIIRKCALSDSGQLLKYFAPQNNTLSNLRQNKNQTCPCGIHHIFLLSRCNIPPNAIKRILRKIFSPTILFGTKTGLFFAKLDNIFCPAKNPFSMGFLMAHLTVICITDNFDEI